MDSDSQLQHNASLDGLRGFAALIVVASHGSLMGLHLLPGLSLAGTGKYGVYLFFVISAYLLSRQWMTALAEKRVTLRYTSGYMLRRVMRIYPLYFLVLLGGLLIKPYGLGVPIDLPSFFGHLTLQEGRGHYWSIPVEFLYYLCIPPICVWMSMRVPYWCRLLGVAFFLGLVHYFYSPASAPENSINLLYYMPVFVCGSMLAWISGVNVPFRLMPSLLLPRWTLDLLILLALIATIPDVFARFQVRRAPEALHTQFLLWGLFWSAVLFGLLRGLLPVWEQVLQHRFFRACGRWCFGIYLLHMPALYLAKRLPFAEAVKPWLGLSMAIGIGALAYLFVERPAIRWGNRVKTVVTA